MGFFDDIKWEEKGRGLDVSDKATSELILHQRDIEGYVKAKISDSEIYNQAKDYFTECILGSINPIMRDQLIAKLKKIILDDEEIADKDYFLRELKEDIPSFLFKCFAYSLCISNKSDKRKLSSESIDVIADYLNLCPKCKKEKLLLTVKGRTIINFKMQYIIPISLNEKKRRNIANSKKIETNQQIPLCRKCSLDYENCDDASVLAENLSDCYLENSNRIKIDEIEENSDLSEEIGIVIQKISTSQIDNNDINLNLDPKSIDEKIGERCFSLKTIIRNNCNIYYSYVRKLFEEVEKRTDVTFNVIASEIRSAYLKISSAIASKEEIFYRLSDFLLNKIGLSQNYRTACIIIISFFVQNCEVFDAPSK